MEEQGIELINVTKKYAKGSIEHPALKDVTLSIKPGEYLGLMGMNGSGKSTLIRLINGLIQPTTGKVSVDGMDTGSPENIPKIRRLVGMVFQNPDNQLICPVVEEEIAFGPENLGLPLPEVKRRVEWSLRAVGLEEMRHHSPHLLSGGQKQKVALASVLAMQPKYLVLDEPTSMLDPASRADLLEQLQALNTRHGMTIILCSHNPQDLIHAHRLVALHRGAIALQGAPREVYAREDRLAEIGLEPPAVYQLTGQLVRAGCKITGEIKTISDLVEYICRQ